MRALFAGGRLRCRRVLGRALATILTRLAGTTTATALLALVGRTLATIIFARLAFVASSAARGLGCRGRVTSPTFTIVNEYEGRTPLFHFDMYRLGSSDELFDIGWEDYLDRGGVCAVEWSEQVADALPEGTVYVTLTRHPEHDGWRSITVEGGAAQ